VALFSSSSGSGVPIDMKPDCGYKIIDLNIQTTKKPPIGGFSVIFRFFSYAQASLIQKLK
jgi:hypothetical protein